MQENAVKQRVRMLEAIWDEEIRKPGNEQVRIGCLMGTGTVDYRMIKGFILVQMSGESNLPDIFLCSHFPFRDKKTYGQSLIAGMKQYIDEWNKHTLSDTHGKVQWQPAVFDKDNESDESYFAANINSLADALEIEEGEETLAVALLPEPNYAPADFSGWLSAVLMNRLSNKVRLILFDLYESKLFGEVEKQFKNEFLRLYPDLDMPGAMSQIAEQAEAVATQPEDKAIASFQKNLLEMNRAIGSGDEKGMQIFRQEALSIAVKNNWPHMEAVVHFFVHGFYMGTEKYELAETEITKAVIKSDLSLEQGTVTDKAMIVQYRITKANMYLVLKQYEKAEEMYKECIDVYKGNDDKAVLSGIYQMLGMCQRKIGRLKDARLSLAEGWQLIRDPAYLKDNIMAQFYAQQMMKAGMDRKAEYKDWFWEMDVLWGKLWYTQLPEGKRGMKKHQDEVLNQLQTAEETIGS